MEDKNSNIEIKVQLAQDPHCLSGLLFLKYFNDNHKYAHSLYEIEKDSFKLIIKHLNEKFDLDCISDKTFTGYEDYKSENEIDDNDGENNKPNNIEVTFGGDPDFGFPPYNSGSGLDRVMIDSSKKIVIDFGYDNLKIVSFDPISDELKAELKKLQFEGFAKKTQNNVHILTHSSDRGMYLSDFKIDDKYVDLDIDSNYNDGFKAIYNSIIHNLTEDQIGLYLLHGVHGTGKTTLIRHLIRKINKRLIFISPTMANQFANPDMIPFLMKYPNSIIIIEDSENIIKKRENGGDQSVSNLLNLSDGILGDCLKFQIICTFNTNKSDIDEALLRKGRLIESYEFGKLTKEKTNNLLTKLGFKKTNKPMRLSDIYNPDENHFDTSTESTIGFKAKKKEIESTSNQ